ncbi:MAG: phosphotransferase family protein [Solirubrobacteraceae bacterium]
MTQLSESNERWSHHGFELNAADEQLLRGPVPTAALRWVATSVGAGARVLGAEPLAGGTSSAVHAVQVDTGAQRLLELVLRRFVRLDWLAEEPDLAPREAAALEVLAEVDLPTPRLVALDPDGSVAGEPSVLMTRLPGRVEWDPPAVDAFLGALAEPLPVIHSVPVARGVSIPDYKPYPLGMHRPPVWALRPDVWERAISLLDESPPPACERAFIHRDYHPGNVLWDGGRVTGIVDWVNASIGSPWADVGHCRVNIASELGREAADRFLDLYRAVSSRTDDYHPYWDISAAIGGLDEDADEQPSPADELFLAAAVARL